MSEFRPTAAAVGQWPRGVFRVPRRLQERGEWAARAWGAGCRGAEDRPCSAGARGNAGVASSRRGRLRGGRAPFRVTSSAAMGRGARDLRRRPARWGSRCGGFGASVRRFWLLHRARGASCAGLTPAACAVAFTVDGFGLLHRPRGASCAGLAPTACAAGLTVRWGWAHRRAFRFPRSARAATAAPRPRRRRPVHGHGHGALHRPRGCSTAQPEC